MCCVTSDVVTTRSNRVCALGSSTCVTDGKSRGCPTVSVWYVNKVEALQRTRPGRAPRRRLSLCVAQEKNKCLPEGKGELSPPTDLLCVWHSWGGWGGTFDIERINSKLRDLFCPYFSSFSKRATRQLAHRWIPLHLATRFAAKLQPSRVYLVRRRQLACN